MSLVIICSFHVHVGGNFGLGSSRLLLPLTELGIRDFLLSGRVPDIGWGVRAGSRVDVLGWACLDDACTLLWASFGLACP